MNNEVKNLIERLRSSLTIGDGALCRSLCGQAADLLKRSWT